MDILLGDASKARGILGWMPKIKFKELVEEMVREDLKLVRRELYGSKNEGNNHYKKGINKNSFSSHDENQKFSIN